MGKLTKTETKEIAREMRSLRCFSGLSELSLNLLAEHALQKSFKKGQFIWRAQELSDFCAVVVDGVVDITSTNQEGEERIIGLFARGDMIGISALIRHGAFPASARVSSPTCRVLLLFIRSLESSLQDSIQREINSWLRECLLRHEQILRDKLAILGAGAVHIRLLDLFEHFRQRFSPHQKSDQFSIPIPISKTQIGKLIEVRAETAIRTLNKWEKAGYLQIDKRGFHLRNQTELRRRKGLS